MTTLYHPITLETAEQAATLPEDTILLHEDYYPLLRIGGRWRNPTAGLTDADLEQLGGFTALVAIETMEEHHERPYAS